jgi:hypothetical protein
VAGLTLAVIVALTSWGAYLVATRRIGLLRSELRGAAAEALAYLGLAVVFLLVNFAVGTALILGLRFLTHRFISVYGVTDATLAILSLLQALVLHCWRARPR